jgi:hypothetical protein
VAGHAGGFAGPGAADPQGALLTGGPDEGAEGQPSGAQQRDGEGARVESPAGDPREPAQGRAQGGGAGPDGAGAGLLREVEEGGDAVGVLDLVVTGDGPRPAR